MDMEMPIYTRLTAYHNKKRIPFAMPGHKNLRALAPNLQECDVTELAQTVDLHHECETVKRANELLSDFYGTKQSFIMTGGSTAGVQSMIASVLKPGETLLASADCHMSVINTCALCGFKIRMIPMKQDCEFAIPSVLCDFEITDDVGAVIVTSPNYYGKIKDICSLAEKCHDAGIPLLVDEAHGAAFKAADVFPKSAVECGADIVCHSAHKTLNALTGAAYLHVCSDRISISRVKKALKAFQSSSPSYPIAASADMARAVMAEMNFNEIVTECREFKKAICDATDIKALKNDDELRLVLNFSAYDISGFKVNEMLSEYYGIDIEMADLYNIVLIVTPWNTHRDFMKLFQALRDIVKSLNKRENLQLIPTPPISTEIIAPSLGWFADTEYIPIENAEGRRCASVISSYPPGTAITITGEIIRYEQIQYIKLLTENNAEITEVLNGRIEVIQ